MRDEEGQTAVLMKMLAAMAASVAALMSFTRLAEPRIVAALTGPLGKEGAHWLALATGVALSVAVYTAVTRVFNDRRPGDGPRAE